MQKEDSIKEIVTHLREYFNIKKYPEMVMKYCNECDKMCYILSGRFDFQYEQIHLTNLGFIEPFHRASILGFVDDGEYKWYIVDVTYGQFFEEETFKKYMFENHKEFSEKLLNAGYIECSIENFIKYIEGFLFSKTYYDVNKDNIETITKNIIKLLYELKMCLCNEKLTYEKVIDIFFSRKILLETKYQLSNRIK